MRLVAHWRKNVKAYPGYARIGKFTVHNRSTLCVVQSHGNRLTQSKYTECINPWQASDSIWKHHLISWQFSSDFFSFWAITGWCWGWNRKPGFRCQWHRDLCRTRPSSLVSLTIVGRRWGGWDLPLKIDPICYYISPALNLQNILENICFIKDCGTK